jgi:hypothetical protein
LFDDVAPEFTSARLNFVSISFQTVMKKSSIEIEK